MIGLLDYDAIASQKIQYPSLELMKMATYLRRNNQSAHIILNLDDLDIYNKIMVFQNDSSLGYPSKVFGRKNTEWYGIAFTDNKYKPMAPEIEACEPTVGIYKLLFKQFLLEDKMKTTQVGYLLNASYLRLSMPLNKRYIRTIRPNRKVLVYDTDAFSGDWENNVSMLLKREIAGFKFIYEQKLHDIELWAKILLSYERRVFNYNPITLTFDFYPESMDVIIPVFKKAIGKNKVESGSWFHLYPNIPPPYKENTIKFAEGIGRQMRAGIGLGWRIPDYRGNPYHPFINALCTWAGGTYFFNETFLNFLLKRDLHKERKFALKLIQQNKKFGLIFQCQPKELKAMEGGLKSYDSQRNHCSIYSDYL